MPVVFRLDGLSSSSIRTKATRASRRIFTSEGGAKAKFWLRPVALASNFAFDARTLRELEAMVEANVPRIERVWNEHFG